MTGLARPIKSGKSPPSYPKYYGWLRRAMSSVAFAMMVRVPSATRGHKESG
jgi:hypothetical protein